MAHKLPQEAYYLAATYQLGTPVKRYMRSGWIIFSSCLAALFFLGWVAVLVAAFTLPSLNPLVMSFRELLLGGALLLSIVILHKTGCHSAYECTHGFVILTGRTREIKYALHWNEVLSTYTAGKHRALYYMTDIYEQTIEVPYYGLWKRCEEAIARSVEQNDEADNELLSPTIKIPRVRPMLSG